MQHASHIPAANAKLPWGSEPDTLPHLPWWPVIFSQTTVEHLHCLHIVFDQFREHNLTLKPSKATFSEKKSPIWHIEFWKKGCDPVTQTWQQLQSACHLKRTQWQRCVPFLVWWDTIGGSSKGLHALPRYSANIWLEKGLAGNPSRFQFQKMPWRLSKHWNKHVWWPPF